ncbi:response regulator transcription factor [Alcanivorax jadensis]|uniref:response regulator transcription factor n=1 Tax=Alcanivorax jadensis TaxID=64988 RepID=UPI002353BF2B|nr:response regulator transcription factor [Alcanivorax jadensis]|tara:strand:+ start:1206 stop:1916 length:711 start_codon:yes stop_codon:yes gene_type:complete
MNAVAQIPSRLLVIEDDAVLSAHLHDFLSERRYQVTLCADGTLGLAAASSDDFDLVLLDILLPGLNGLELLGQLRHRSPVPVIVVSALGDEQARIQGLIGGADDYLPKPFSMAELAVRVEAVLRRVSMERHRTVSSNSVGGLVLEEPSETACYRQRDLGLTTTEFRLLQVLLEHHDQVLSKPFLYQTVLYRGCGRHDRSLDLHVSHLRRKLRDAGAPESSVRTVWGQGYTLITEHL